MEDWEGGTFEKKRDQARHTQKPAMTAYTMIIIMDSRLWATGNYSWQDHAEVSELIDGWCLVIRRKEKLLQIWFHRLSSATIIPFHNLMISITSIWIGIRVSCIQLFPPILLPFDLLRDPRHHHRRFTLSCGSGARVHSLVINEPFLPARCLG